MKRFRPNIGIHQNLLYGDNLDDRCRPITTDDSRPIQLTLRPLCLISLLYI